jgi:(1->4)-alpha-D-glucan 1-alpha-D-glucosylmutase
VRYFETRLPLSPRSYTSILQPALALLTKRNVPDEHRQELESILTALSHLPHRQETDPQKLTERLREKEIIKRRLVRRCEECPQMREAIERAMRATEGTVGNPRSFDAFDALLSAQVYRLSFWRVAAEEINYRRFFDINSLAAIRMEATEVFEATHRLIFQLIQRGAVNGLRIDHVDGLCFPGDYLRNLQQRSMELLRRTDTDRPLYLLVEKILLGDERLPSNWPVHGTTGYDFTNQSTGLFVDPVAEQSLTDTYRKFLVESLPFSEIIYRSKIETMHLSLASEMNMLGHMLERLAEQNRWYRDFTLNALTDAIREVIACFPVYRAYVAPNEDPSAADREAIIRAVRLAKRRNPGIERSVFNFLGEILFGRFPENLDEEGRERHMRFVLKFQQCTGPTMAKGLEDTAFYIYHRLVALNEVGGTPERFGCSPADFVQKCAERLQDYPHAMLATSTHDTKRGEDVRMRIAAVSELPELWRKNLRRWTTINRRAKSSFEDAVVPDLNEEYLLYQTLLGTWPGELENRSERTEYVRRIEEYMIKAIKEAKTNSSWIQPNEEWEAGVREFVGRILRRGPNRFVASLQSMAQQVAQLGMINSLSQTVLKCTLPGVPDFYQGNELWDLRLVDPDNRQPVDFAARESTLESAKNADLAKLFVQWPDGRIKLAIIQRLLKYRINHRRLFERGSLTSLATAGQHAASCFVFAREHEGEFLIVAVPRLSKRVGFPPLGERWADTSIALPKHIQGCQMRNILTSEQWTADQSLAAGQAFASVPVAVYEKF